MLTTCAGRPFFISTEVSQASRAQGLQSTDHGCPGSGTEVVHVGPQQQRVSPGAGRSRLGCFPHYEPDHVRPVGRISAARPGADSEQLGTDLQRRPTAGRR